MHGYFHGVSWDWTPSTVGVLLVVLVSAVCLWRSRK